MSGNTSEAEIIMQMERDNCTRLQSGDVDALIATFADDALQMSPGAENVTGKANIHEQFQIVATTTGYELSWEPVYASVSASGDMAWVHGTASVKTPEGDAAQPSKYLVVYEKRDGEWLVVADMLNANS